MLISLFTRIITIKHNVIQNIHTPRKISSQRWKGLNVCGEVKRNTTKDPYPENPSICQSNKILSTNTFHKGIKKRDMPTSKSTSQELTAHRFSSLVKRTMLDLLLTFLCYYCISTVSSKQF